MDYWHNQVTGQSWQVLQQLKFPFVLIGGWAVYLWTGGAKSKDIDIIVDIQTLSALKGEGLRKNSHLKKYEIRKGDIDIDIYVPWYSTLGIPLNTLRTTSIQGFTVPAVEELLILKQVAEQARAPSEKGEKDRIDLMSLLCTCTVDFLRYRQLLATHQLGLLPRLLRIVRSFQDFRYLGLTPAQLKHKKQELAEQLRRL